VFPLGEQRIELGVSFSTEGTGIVKFLFFHLFSFHLVFFMSSHCFFILSQSLPGKINDRDCPMEKDSGPAHVLGRTKEGQSILGFVFLRSL